MGKSRRFETTYNVTPTPIKDARRIDIWIPFPRTTDHQDIHAVEVQTKLPYTVHYEPAYGNAILHAQATDNDFDHMDVTIVTQATRREWTTDWHRLKPAAAPGNLAHFSRQLSENRSIRFEPQIVEIAASLKEGKPCALEIGKAAYRYVLDHMDYDKTVDGAGDGDSGFACAIGKGNCTDFHSLFLAIIRACGIPGQFEIGLAFPAGLTEGDITYFKCGYHCWASFYVHGIGWIPVDASEAAQKPGLRDYYFGALDENRFLLSVGRDIDMVPQQRGRSANFFTEPTLEADNGASVGYEKKLTFQDLG
jgi:transglutaminase-like putative cysteine protease